MDTSEYTWERQEQLQTQNLLKNQALFNYILALGTAITALTSLLMVSEIYKFTPPIWISTLGIVCGICFILLFIGIFGNILQLIKIKLSLTSISA
jgi:hypothetical protein